MFDAELCHTKDYFLSELIADEKDSIIRCNGTGTIKKPKTKPLTPPQTTRANEK
jgi:hypothetical protein